VNDVTAPAVLPLHGLSVPLAALEQLLADFPHLPAPTINITTIYPDRLELSFFDNLSAFEAWRAALRISPQQVDCATQSSGRTWRLSTTTETGAATIRLVGYTDTPTQIGGELR
jgi:hypothetical protein